MSCFKLFWINIKEIDQKYRNWGQKFGLSFFLILSRYILIEISYSKQQKRKLENKFNKKYFEKSKTRYPIIYKKVFPHFNYHEKSA